MNIKNLITSAATILSLSAFSALAEPALIYDLGGKFDKSFNEMAFSEQNGGKLTLVEVTEK